MATLRFNFLSSTNLEITYTHNFFSQYWSSCLISWTCMAIFTELCNLFQKDKMLLALAVLAAFFPRGGQLENLCAERGSCCTGRSDRYSCSIAAFFPRGGQLGNLCAERGSCCILAAQIGTAVLAEFFPRGGQLQENLCAERGSCCTGRSDRYSCSISIFATWRTAGKSLRWGRQLLYRPLRQDSCSCRIFSKWRTAEKPLSRARQLLYWPLGQVQLFQKLLRPVQLLMRNNDNLSSSQVLTNHNLSFCL